MIAYSEPLSAPVNVTWEITTRCNIHCNHCLSAELQQICAYELDFDECKWLIDKLHEFEVFQINFGGGEPFLRDDFFDILDYASRKGITLCVSTNGTLLDEPMVKRLKSIRNLYLQVSLDGASAQTNDLIRGKGTYERIIAGIELLIKDGFPASCLSTNTVVTAINFREILAIYTLGRHYGIKTRLSRFRPAGKAKKVWEVYHLRGRQLSKLSNFLNKYRDVLTGDSFFSITAKERSRLGLNMCGAAKMTCSIQPDGTVYPCAFLQDSPFRAGNILEEPLNLIWDNAPIFNQLRKNRVTSCESCARFAICHGGCPAVAYFLTASLNQPDPECLTSLHHFGDPENPEDTKGAIDHVRIV